MTSDRILYRTEVRFNSIYVIESLPDGDPKTGRDLYDQVIYPATLQLPGIHTQFLSAPTSGAFLGALAEVGRNVRLYNHIPILHIEAHGSDDGIGLADGTEVTWRDLVPILGDINQACKMNLTVIAISCMGWNLTHSLMPADRAPLFMLVGPPAAMTGEDLLAATKRFYEAIAQHVDMNKGLEAMNDGQEYDTWRLKPATAEILYCRVFRHYLDELGGIDQSEQRVDAVVANVLESRPLHPQKIDDLRASVRRDLSDHRLWYDHWRHTFLMLDLFPDSEGRFGLTYDLCMPSITQEIAALSV